MRHVIRRSLVALLLSGTACASGGAPASSSRTRPRTDLLTREQIEGTSFGSVLDLVRALRSNWLNTRGPDTINGPPSEVQVHVDNVRVGGPATLRDIHPNDVASIQYFDPITAAGRWGLGYTAGAIQVTTRKR